jgi:sedoheptulokinase
VVDPRAAAWLGVDCGTSKVAVAVVDAAGNQLHVAGRRHEADLSVPAGRHEQDAERILVLAEELVQEIRSALRLRIVAIGFAGQMHGVVLHDAEARPLSPLVTWQDRRTAADGASQVRMADPPSAVAILTWWARQGELPTGAHAGTIHGLLAQRWGQLPHSPIDPTDLHGWGGLARSPELASLQLPRIVDHGTLVGRLSRAAASRLGLAPGIPLAAPLGDHQASVRATLDEPDEDLLLTIGTGCQLSALVSRERAVVMGHAERRPYDDRHDLVAATPLCGGAAWRWLAVTVAQWITDAGLRAPPMDEIYARLDALGMAADDALHFAPHLLGERHDPFLTGTITGLRLDTGSLGQLARAVARGVIANARELLPDSVRRGRRRVVASGNALRRSRLLRAMAEQELGVPLVLGERIEEAATGAALVALGACTRTRTDTHRFSNEGAAPCT